MLRTCRYGKQIYSLKKGPQDPHSLSKHSNPYMLQKEARAPSIFSRMESSLLYSHNKE